MFFFGMGFVLLFWVDGSTFLYLDDFFGVALKRSNFGNLPLKNLNSFFLNVLE